MKYDDNMKEDGGSRIPMPSQQDFLKIKIQEREQILSKLIEEGKEEIRLKHLKKTNETTFDNPYDRIVRNTQLR